MKVQPELIGSFKELPSDKKLYFASDFHLGAPSGEESLEREKKIIKWLEHISKDASAIFLVGDIFDFWFEYKTTIPRGFIRFQGKLAELSDRGVKIFLFTGNHDLWLKNYFPSEIGVEIIKGPAQLHVNEKKIFIAHGDGLGSGDTFYKILKHIFTNKLCIWLFNWLHPDVGISIAKYWSKKSRYVSLEKDESFRGEDEKLLAYCKSVYKKEPYDYFVFGHRHLPLELFVTDESTYFNLGEWFTQCNYLEFDGTKASLKTFED